MALLRQYTHAIIDMAGVVSDDWHDELPVRPLVPRFFLNTDDDIMPVLLTLDSVSEAHMKLLGANLEDAKDRPFMRLLSCLLYVAPDTHSNSLAHHLTNMLMLDGPGREGPGKLIRYYRNDVFLHLLRILPPPRIRQLFGPVQTWTLPFQQGWPAFAPPEITGSAPAYWAVNEEQEQRIKQIGLINNILIRRKEKTGMRWASVEDFHADAEKVERILLFSERRYQLRDEPDQILFAEHSLLYGEAFHEHPKIQQLLQVVQGKGWGYAGGCAEITENDWKDIAARRQT